MTTIFFLSFAVLCVLVVSKIFEIKFKKVDLLARFFAYGDKKIHELINLLVYKYNRYKKISNIFIFEFLPSYLYELLIKAKDYVSKKYYNAGDGFRGRRVLRSNGSVSFFLERLASERKVEKKF
jgi:uncharacterized membrane protein